ncbi:MAG: glycine--tRNA ligase subunit beta, partial [Acidobacteriota bacterium]
MSALPFLLEIGVEEIPDWMIPPALDHLRELFHKLLADNRIEAAGIEADATPRRLVLRAASLPERQADSEEIVLGPPASVAFNNGQPTGAALGFARKCNAPVADLEVRETPRGAYLCYRRTIAGKPAAEILAAALPELILSVHFPKTMYWTGKGGPRFIRPIRWLVA